MAISPITGELVPLAEMAEHMRISLIDPQWKVQREAMLSKIRETTQASDDEISRNLVDLAGHRPDVFGTPFPLPPLHPAISGPFSLCLSMIQHMHVALATSSPIFLIDHAVPHSVTRDCFPT